MEAFAIKNYVFHNLTDILLKVAKIYPEIFTAEIVADEMISLKNYIHSITFIGDTIPEDNVMLSVADAEIESPVINTKKTKDKTNNKKKKTEIEHPPVNKLLDLQHIFNEPSPSAGLADEHMDSVNNRCAARVLTNPKECVAADFMHIDSTTKIPVYGRQCKNVKSGADTEFCSIHKRSTPYGIFREEPTEELKLMFEKKYKRACDVAT